MDSQVVITIATVGVVGVLIPILIIKGVPRIIKLSAIRIALGVNFYIFGIWMLDASGLTN